MKTFTLEEANGLLPIVESLLRQAIAAKEEAERLEGEIQSLRQRIFLSGGMTVDIAGVARNRAEVETQVEKAKEALAEIDSIGVQVKDLDTGLLDFPCRIDGELVLLCWRRGETRIEYWHTLGGGFSREAAAGRTLRTRLARPSELIPPIYGELTLFNNYFPITTGCRLHT